MPSFGRSAAPPFVSGGLAIDTKYASRYTLSEAGELSELVAYLAGAGYGGSQPVKGIIYADSAGAPGALLGTSAELVVVSDDLAAFRSLPFAATLSLAAGDYWLGLHAGGVGGGEVNFGFENIGVATLRQASDAYADGPAASYGATTDSGVEMAIYANYALPAANAPSEIQDREFSIFSTYAPTVTDLTFGKSTIGASTNTLGAGARRAYKFTLPQSGNVSKLQQYLSGGAAAGTTQAIRGLIYADSAGTPGSLRAVTPQVLVPGNIAAGWVDLAFSSPVNLPAGDYWLGNWTGTLTGALLDYYDVVANAKYRLDEAYSATASPADPWGAGSTVSSQQASIRAVYLPAAAVVAGTVPRRTLLGVGL